MEGVGVPKERESNIAGSDLESKVIPVILVRKVFILLRGALQMGIRGSTVEANSAASSRPGKRSGKERRYNINRGVTLPICAVIKLKWAVIKFKLDSIKNCIFNQYAIILLKDTETTVTQI